MGLFEWLFGKKPIDSGTTGAADDIDVPPANAQPVDGPPEFVRAVEMQRAYWTYRAEECVQLQARGLEQLGWPERLRLHHLICLQRLATESTTADEKCRESVSLLLAPDSPYRPRTAMVWQGQSAQPGESREPDMQGEFLNPSITHLGCLEIYRLDADNQPTRLDFVSFDELTGVLFGPPNLIRIAKLFYEDGSDEIVFVPLLYGLTWTLGNEYDRAGRMTRFEAHLDSDEAATLGASGIGVGQQDFSIRNDDGSGNLFGLGSVAEISFPLDMRDPRFDEKARARGIDPDEVRRNMGVGN